MTLFTGCLSADAIALPVASRTQKEPKDVLLRGSWEFKVVPTSITHLLGSFPVVSYGLRFAVFSLQPIKPDKIEIWAPQVINEYKTLSDK